MSGRGVFSLALHVHLVGFVSLKVVEAECVFLSSSGTCALRISALPVPQAPGATCVLVPFFGVLCGGVATAVVVVDFLIGALGRVCLLTLPQVAGALWAERRAPFGQGDGSVCTPVAVSPLSDS